MCSGALGLTTRAMSGLCCFSYTKPKGQIPDYNAPVILHAKRPTVEDFCNHIHKTLINNFK